MSEPPARPRHERPPHHDPTPALPSYETIRLSGPRVSLRPWRPDDAAVMATASADPEIARFCMMPPGYTMAMAREFLADAPRAWAEDGWLHLALTQRGADDIVGAIGLLRYDALSATAELGYWVLPRHRGRGLARGGVELLRDWALGTLGLRRIEIGTLVTNPASRHVARTLGFTPEVLLRSYRPWLDGRSDCVLYALVRDGGEGSAAGAAASADPSPLAGLPTLVGPSPLVTVPDEELLPALATARTDYPATEPVMPSAPPRLGDGAIVLRPYTDDDLADLVTACNDPETQRWIAVLPQPYTNEDGRAFLGQAATGWERYYDAFYCIADAASDRLLGGCGLHANEAWAGVAEIGYHVAPWARRRGVATAAARLVAHWALDVLKLARVQILADTRNAASGAVATRLGFVREGVQRLDHGRPGDLGDHAVFSLLPGDPRPW